MGTVVSITAAVARLRAYRREHEIAPSRFAADAGVAEAQLRNIDSAEWNPTLRTLEKLDAKVPPDYRPRKTASR